MRVDVQVIEPTTGKRSTTNVFHFAFNVSTDIHVVPETYEEAMLYINGRRIYEKGCQRQTEGDAR